ncbi:hypothetical protein ACT17C_02680, partial [Bacillus subtilis]
QTIKGTSPIPVMTSLLLRIPNTNQYAIIRIRGFKTCHNTPK